jgi:hypothetical protein
MKMQKVDNVDMARYKAQKRVYRRYKNEQKITYDIVGICSDADAD